MILLTTNERLLLIHIQQGYVPAPKAFLEGLRKICDREGILLITDEVQSGFGRTGKMFCGEYSGVRPDVRFVNSTKALRIHAYLLRWTDRDSGKGPR